MPNILFRFYAELNEHLSPERRQHDFTHAVAEGTTVGEAITTLGIPENQIELLLVNGESAGVSHVLKEGDRVSVYPVFDAMDVGSVTKMEARPARRTRFVLDVHLGKLAHHLRMLGFDAAYRNNFTPAEMVRIASAEDRILLSKSKGLVEHPSLTASYRVQSSDPREQLLEVLRRFDLVSLVNPFTRCLHCNAPVDPIPKSDVLDLLPEKSRATYNEFTTCPSCGRVYWKGSHVERMRKYMEEVLGEVEGRKPG